MTPQCCPVGLGAGSPGPSTQVGRHRTIRRSLRSPGETTVSRGGGPRGGTSRREPLRRSWPCFFLLRDFLRTGGCVCPGAFSPSQEAPSAELTRAGGVGEGSALGPSRGLWFE